LIRIVRRLGRRVAAWLGGIALGNRWVAGRGGPVEPVRKVLVIRIDERVGNVLLTTPLLVELSRALPAARVDVLVARSKMALVQGLVRVIPFERKDFFKRPWAFLALLGALRRERYDVAIDASHWHEMSVSSSMLLAITGARVRIAHDRGRSRAYATHALSPPRAGDSQHEIASKLALLEPLGIRTTHASMKTLLGTGSETAERVLATLPGRSSRRVGIAPGSRKRDHRAAREVFVAVAQEARAMGLEPLILWGPGEETLAREVAETSGATMAPPTNLEELAAAIRACCAVITNDTGPMHLAVACGTPTIALFVGADPSRWGHAEAPHAVIVADGRSNDSVVREACEALARSVGRPVDGAFKEA
jgi:ADP-heptose:LPS heptosyltransferase